MLKTQRNNLTRNIHQISLITMSVFWSSGFFLMIIFFLFISFQSIFAEPNVEPTLEAKVRLALRKAREKKVEGDKYLIEARQLMRDSEFGKEFDLHSDLHEGFDDSRVVGEASRAYEFYLNGARERWEESARLALEAKVIAGMETADRDKYGDVIFDKSIPSHAKILKSLIPETTLGEKTRENHRRNLKFNIKSNNASMTGSLLPVGPMVFPISAAASGTVAVGSHFSPHIKAGIQNFFKKDSSKNRSYQTCGRVGFNPIVYAEDLVGNRIYSFITKQVPRDVFYKDENNREQRFRVLDTVPIGENEAQTKDMRCTTVFLDSQKNVKGVVLMRNNEVGKGDKEKTIATAAMLGIDDEDPQKQYMAYDVYKEGFPSIDWVPLICWETKEPHLFYLDAKPSSTGSPTNRACFHTDDMGTVVEVECSGTDDDKQLASDSSQNKQNDWDVNSKRYTEKDRKRVVREDMKGEAMEKDLHAFREK